MNSVPEISAADMIEILKTQRNAYADEAAALAAQGQGMLTRIRELEAELEKLNKPAIPPEPAA